MSLELYNADLAYNRDLMVAVKERLATEQTFESIIASAQWMREMRAKIYMPRDPSTSEVQL